MFWLYLKIKIKEELKKIFEIYSNEMSLESDVDFNPIIGLCQDLCGADI